MKKAVNSITRSIRIHQDEIRYELRYSKKARYLRLQIKNGKELELIVPRGYELKEAESFLIKKADWIRKHLKSGEEQKTKFMLLGKEIKISQSYRFFIKRHRVGFKENELKIISPSDSPDDIEKIYETWLKHYSKSYIPERAKELAGSLGFAVKKITVRSQKTRWGSASTRGSLSFNFRLMRFRKEVIDYVIIHELCHFKEMNHSKKFWSLVEKYCPDYKALRHELKG